jgi:hypothetical protein
MPHLSQVTAAGAGLLLGSALCVIIPEGFEAMHEAAEGTRHVGG